MLLDKERRILKYLRENARAKITDLARKVNLPRASTYEHVNNLVASGIIRKYLCLIDFKNLGLPIHVKVLFRVPTANKLAFGKELVASQRTNNVIKLGNEFDYLASFVFQSMEEMHDFLDSLTVKYKLSNYQQLYVAKELKREGFDMY